MKYFGVKHFGMKDFDMKDFGMKYFGMKHFGMKDFDMKDFGMKHFDIGMNHFGMINFGLKYFGVEHFGMKDFGMKDFGMKHFGVKHFGSKPLSKLVYLFRVAKSFEWRSFGMSNLNMTDMNNLNMTDMELMFLRWTSLTFMTREFAIVRRGNRMGFQDDNAQPFLLFFEHGEGNDAPCLRLRVRWSSCKFQRNQWWGKWLGPHREWDREAFGWKVHSDHVAPSVPNKAGISNVEA